MKSKFKRKKSIIFITILAILCMTGCDRKQPDFSEYDENTNESRLYDIEVEETEKTSVSANVDDSSMESASKDEAYDALSPENLQTEYNKCIIGFVEEQQEMYTDRTYLAPSVKVSGSKAAEGGYDYTTVYYFTGDKIELTLTNSREAYYQFNLNYNGAEQAFNGDGWDIMGTPDYVDVYLYDMTGDGREELVIVYTHRTFSTQDSEIEICVVDLDTMSMLDTAKDLDTTSSDADNFFAAGVKQHIKARRDRTELDKQISVRINDLKNKYSDDENVKAYIYVKEDEPDNIYIVVMEKGQVQKALCIADAAGNAKTSYLEDKTAVAITEDDAYSLVGIRVIK